MIGEGPNLLTVEKGDLFLFSYFLTGNSHRCLFQHFDKKLKRRLFATP